MRRTLLAGLALFAPPALAAPVLPDLAMATFIPGAPIDNPYFPIVPGRRLTYEGSGEDDGETFTERSVQRYAGVGPTLLGVRTTAVLDRGEEDGVLVEETLDYYAQDTAGNVWYFGEDVTNYRYDDNGAFVSTDSASAWRAGVNDALPGFIMPADLTPGFNYYQEFAKNDDALDQAAIWARGLSVDGYSDVLATFETSEVEPDARELKYYAPGVGLIRVEEGVDEDFEDPELVATLTDVSQVPLPMSLPLLSCAVAGLAFVGRGPGARRRPARTTPPVVSTGV